MKWTKLFPGWGQGQHERRLREQAERLLPANSSDIPPSAFPAKEVTKIALRLK
jgi:hypothetical protein